MADWGNYPLPPGWEAKYDPGQKRYFYIHHATKSTSWEDPRKTAYDQQQRAAQQGTTGWSVLNTGGRPAAQSLTPGWNSAGRSPSPQMSSQASHSPQPPRSTQSSFHPPRSPQQHHMPSQPSPQPPKSPQRRRSSTPHAQHAHHRTPTPESTPGQGRPDTTAKPTWEQHVEDKYGLTVQHIKDDDEEETSFSNQSSPNMNQHIFNTLKHQYPKADAEIIKDVLIGVNNDETRAKNQLQSLGYSQAFKRQPAKAATPQPSPGPSEAVKNRIKEKMIKEFSNCSAYVVEMALDASQYDEARSRILLHSMGSTKASPAKSHSRPSSGKKSSTTTTNTAARAVSPLRTTFNINIPSPVSVSSMSTSARKDQISKKTATASKKASGPTKTKAKPKCAGGVYISENRMQSSGPNVHLPKGPDLDNILDTYVHAKGPNPDNREGPPAATGPDRSLTSGPNRSLLCGAA